ncbi:hypothetical protein PR002_g3559 [Phytophthora rubi]|uniref:Uncharacterized protein n=1 Tax=Phytophthora rubi TaxID=129364 RepID=A0A6A3NN86_9STRA|nr:hypothetical protein PR002_g3559 [Phytophthora rubi]
MTPGCVYLSSFSRQRLVQAADFGPQCLEVHRCPPLIPPVRSATRAASPPRRFPSASRKVERRDGASVGRANGEAHADSDTDNKETLDAALAAPEDTMVMVVTRVRTRVMVTATYDHIAHFPIRSPLPPPC